MKHRLTEEDLFKHKNEQAMLDGQRAYRDGETSTDNPYPLKYHFRQLREAWLEGWKSARRAEQAFL